MKFEPGDIIYDGNIYGLVLYRYETPRVYKIKWFNHSPAIPSYGFIDHIHKNCTLVTDIFRDRF